MTFGRGSVVQEGRRVSQAAMLSSCMPLLKAAMWSLLDMRPGHTPRLSRTGAGTAASARQEVVDRGGQHDESQSKDRDSDRDGHRDRDRHVSSLQMIELQ